MKCIIIDSCSKCPSLDHKGAFGRIPYIPVCRKVGKELLYVVTDNGRFGRCASRVELIPDWCPLTDYNVE